MKDRKFAVLCILGLAWLVIFVAMLFGIKIHPRVEQLITVLCVGWFAFWTLSLVLSKSKPKKEDENAETKENSESE